MNVYVAHERGDLYHVCNVRALQCTGTATAMDWLRIGMARLALVDLPQQMLGHCCQRSLRAVKVNAMPLVPMLTTRVTLGMR